MQELDLTQWEQDTDLHAMLALLDVAAEHWPHVASVTLPRKLVPAPGFAGLAAKLGGQIEALSLGWSGDEDTNNSAAATLVARFTGLRRLQWGMGEFPNHLFKEREDAVVMGHISSVMLQQLGQLTGLQELQLGGHALPYSEADMDMEWEEAMWGMNQSSSLPLPPRTISLLPLAALTGLTQLQLGSEQHCLHWVDGYGAALSALTALEVLGVRTLSWSPHKELLAAMAPLHKLRKLTLDSYSEDGFYHLGWDVHFGQLTALEELNLPGCNVDDAVVRVLATFSSLQYLHVCEVEYTSAVMHSVLPQLRMLEAWGCRRAGVPLAQLMPVLQVLKCQWPEGQLDSIHGHLHLTTVELGDQGSPSAALAACLATLPRLQRAA